MSDYTYYSDPLRKLTLYQGVTTADGAGDGSTLVCSDLASQDEDFNGNHVIVTSGTYRNARDINGTTLTGTVTFTSALKGQIVKGTTFMIVGFRTTPAEVAAIEAKVDVIDGIVDNILSQKIEVQDVIIYPVSEHASTTELTDDGTAPAYYADTEGGTATLEGSPNVHWLEDINFEQVGTITVISMFLEFEWEHKTSGGTAYSKIQISGDGGNTWVDVTDSITETNAAYQTKLRAGVGNFLSTITAGANKLQFRLVSWEAGGATSSAKISSSSYVWLTYRKS